MRGCRERGTHVSESHESSSLRGPQTENCGSSRKRRFTHRLTLGHFEKPEECCRRLKTKSPKQNDTPALYFGRY